MNTNIRVAISFATFADTVLNNFAILVVACLKSNALFPSPPVTTTVLMALQEAFQAALTATAEGGRMATAAKNEARLKLIAALRCNASYVQSLGLQNISQVLSSGYDVVNPNTTSTPLTTPVLIRLDNSVSTKLQVYLQAVPNAKAYQVQFSSGTGPWQDGSIFANTRNIILSNLNSGTVYTVRVRAIGGSTGFSEWSAAISLMVI